MVEPSGQDERELEPRRLAAFRDDLRALHGPTVDVPPAVDDAVVSMARRHFARHRRSRLLMRMAAVSSAAAAIVLVVWVARTWDGPLPASRVADAGPNALPAPAGPGPDATAAQQDLDHNGLVDIRDAFLLARGIERGETPKRQWDINGDGKVDRADVDTIAMAAVKLDGGTLQ